MSKSVYLDSSDFSDLSLPDDRIRPEDKALLTCLREARDHRTANFYLSPAHLSEAIHASETNKENALRRANLMRELCGTNALRYPTDISKKEITIALSNSDRALTLKDTMSSDDEWFGLKLTPPDLKARRLQVGQEIEQHLRALPRAERRKLTSQLDISKKSGRLLFKRRVQDGRWRTPCAEFPFSLLDEDLFLDWFLGEKSDSDVATHLRNILLNPNVVFQHVADDPGHRETLYMMLRKGGINMSASLEEVGRKLMQLDFLATQIGQKIDAKEIARQIFPKTFARELLTAFSEQSIEHLSDAEIIKLIAKCPSVAALTHAVRAYFETLAQSNLMRSRSGNSIPTTPEESDFGDFTHLMYAPYFDIFRCDARFGEHLKRYQPVQRKIAARRGRLLELMGT